MKILLLSPIWRYLRPWWLTFLPFCVLPSWICLKVELKHQWLSTGSTWRNMSSHSRKRRGNRLGLEVQKIDQGPTFDPWTILGAECSERRLDLHFATNWTRGTPQSCTCKSRGAKLSWPTRFCSDSGAPTHTSLLYESLSPCHSQVSFAYHFCLLKWPESIWESLRCSIDHTGTRPKLLQLSAHSRCLTRAQWAQKQTDLWRVRQKHRVLN